MENPKPHFWSETKKEAELPQAIIIILQVSSRCNHCGESIFRFNWVPSIVPNQWLQEMMDHLVNEVEQTKKILDQTKSCS